MHPSARLSSSPLPASAAEHHQQLLHAQQLLQQQQQEQQQQQQQHHQGVGQDVAPVSSGPNLEGEDGAREEPIAPPPTLQLPETEGGDGGGGAESLSAVCVDAGNNSLYNNSDPFGKKYILSMS